MSKQTEELSSSATQNVDINLLELLKLVLNKKHFLIKVTLAFTVLGFIFALTTPKEYKSWCTLIPETMSSESKISGSIGGLASLAGIDIGGMSGSTTTISPSLYKSVSESTPFLFKLMYEDFFIHDLNKKISLFDYIENHQKTSLVTKALSVPAFLLSKLSLIISYFTISEIKIDRDQNFDLNKEPIQLTYEESAVIAALRDRIEVTLDWELNIVWIQVEMQDPKIAADIALFAMNYITEYVVNYTTQKSLEQLRFIEQQYKKKKEEFNDAQMNLAEFRDMNKNVNSARAKTEEQRLESEYNLAYNVYNNLAQQKQQVELLLNEVKPVFTILEPVGIPVDNHKPNRLLILVFFMVFGLLLALVYLIIINRSAYIVDNP